MMDCKSMETNPKKLSDSASYSDLVDPTMYRLSRECSRQIKHLKVLLQLGISHDLWDNLETSFYSTQYNKDKVCHNQCCK
jgi:hypothetical protein